MIVNKSCCNISAITLPWYKYEYICIPQGIIISSNVFQHIMKKLFHNMKHKVKIDIDNIIILGKSSFQDNLHDVNIVIDQLDQMGIQV